MTPWGAVLGGAAAGACNGALARWSLGKALRRADTVFYSVFVGGIFYRLLFLAAAVWLLRAEKYIIIAAFTASLIAVQLVFEAVPLKQHGIKRNS